MLHEDVQEASEIPLECSLVLCSIFGCRQQDELPEVAEGHDLLKLHSRALPEARHHTCRSTASVSRSTDTAAQ